MSQADQLEEDLRCHRPSRQSGNRRSGACLAGLTMLLLLTRRRGSSAWHNDGGSASEV